MSSAAGELKARLAESPVKPHDIAVFLDGISHAERVEACRSLGRSEQRRLYEAVDGFRPLELADLVPPEVGDLEPVRHFGKNTLPAFTHFEKRFCRPRDVDPACRFVQQKDAGLGEEPSGNQHFLLVAAT